MIPFRQALRTWFAISLQTFGGPAGQIAVMQRTLVEERRWIGQQRFNHALSYCMLPPGPEVSAACSAEDTGGAPTSACPALVAKLRYTTLMAWETRPSHRRTGV
jgi:hypothetical protein